MNPHISIDSYQADQESAYDANDAIVALVDTKINERFEAIKDGQDAPYSAEAVAHAANLDESLAITLNHILSAEHQADITAGLIMLRATLNASQKEVA